VNQKLFHLLLRPIEAVLASISPIIDQQALSQKLFFADFVKKLLFAYLEQVSSLRSLSVELQTNQKCQELGLAYTPFSTLKDGFYRFSSEACRTLFETVLSEIQLKRIKGIDEIGLFRVIDGSLFPTLIQMSWSEYRKRKNAFKLHLQFELNRMIPTEFLIGSGKSSERDFLLKVLEQGVTYIADRGYASFEIIAKLLQSQAYFVFRVKDNLLYEVQEVLSFRDEKLPNCFREVRDEVVLFKNDKHQSRVRLIQFRVAGSYFRLMTNRWELSRLQIIILYAYRWQIELFFKYLKRTLNGLHLFNHSENGVGIQFYILMTLALLLLKFKQQREPRQKKKVEKAEKNEANPSEWIKKVSEIFYGSWKISKKWLLIVKNSLSKVVDNELFTLLDSC
jgi:Transposase DDE domain